MTSARDLADRFHRRWLEANPFAATSYGIPGYDDLVPDESEAGPHAWRDQISERLRTGAGKGRLPVAPLAEQAIIWAEGVLAGPGPRAVLTPRPPQGWDAAAEWEEERRAAAEEVVKPALARWV